MKITVTLTDAQVKGIKTYLSVTGDSSPSTSEQVRQYISQCVDTVISNPHEAVSDYILRAESE